jgi:hypothetical protein
MKTFSSTTMIATLLLCIHGCSSKQSDQLTDNQKDQIKKEIVEVFDSIMVRLERLDAEGALQYYSPNFVAFGSGGERFSFQDLKKYYVDFYSSSTSYKWTSNSFNFITINKETVVITTDGKNESVMKSGEKIIFEPSHYTFAFEKIEGQWKLFYHHFSGTFVKQDALK